MQGGVSPTEERVMSAPQLRATIVAIFLAAVAFGFEAASQPAASPTFTEVVDSLDLATKTPLYVKQYWLENKGKEVAWGGVVKNVTGGRGKAELQVANESRRTFKGFNLVLVTHDIATASKLEIGQPIRFTGSLHKHKGRKGNPIILYLNEVEFR
jgi:hypothetical protein